MKKSTRIASYLAIFGVVFATGLLIGNSLPTHSLSSTQQETSVLNNLFNGKPVEDLNLRTFWQVRELLKNKYIHTDKMVDVKLGYGAVKGMVSALDDPYTEFMDPDETIEFNESLNNELEGIGAEMTVRNQALTVVQTLKGSPAQKAGLLPDDIVYKIDGEETGEMTLYDAINKIRGKKGTSVTLTLIREGKDKPFDLEIARDTIAVDSVTYEESAEKGIWLVAINQFSDDTKMEFNKALNDIKTKNPKGIILDLRYNGGGYLEGAVDVLSGFIKGEKQVVSIEYRDAKNNEKLKTTGLPQFPEIPLVVLVNKGTASASEIVALAIKDMKRGVIMGTTSYGKGTVQEVDPLPDGSSLRYTIAKWYSPNGTNINGVGIVPDQVIEVKDEDFDKKFDRQLDEAVKYLKNL